ncbi:MAG: hypothetical protein DRR04_12095 [Gammaproteobacteria bacterium]|nr:MAG: hypothetical protein DRR04_12095 [Gammaproteobacteria bacterium]
MKFDLEAKCKEQLILEDPTTFIDAPGHHTVYAIQQGLDMKRIYLQEDGWFYLHDVTNVIGNEYI